jgi:hypothetical protein
VPSIQVSIPTYLPTYLPTLSRVLLENLGTIYGPLLSLDGLCCNITVSPMYGRWIIHLPVLCNVSSSLYQTVRKRNNRNYHGHTNTFSNTTATERISVSLMSRTCIRGVPGLNLDYLQSVQQNTAVAPYILVTFKLLYKTAYTEMYSISKFENVSFFLGFYSSVLNVTVFVYWNSVEK